MNISIFFNDENVQKISDQQRYFIISIQIYLYSIMKKDQIIQNLYKQNQQLAKEVEKWKHKYYMIEKQYQRLRHLHPQHQGANKQAHQSPKKENDQVLQTTFLSDYFFPAINSSQEIPSNEQNVLNKTISTKKQKMMEKVKSQFDQFDSFDFFQESGKKENQLSVNSCQLIEGCFILQKLSSIDHFDPLRFIFPAKKFNSIRNMLDIVYRFVFVDEEIPEIHDDQFQSRKNQILFGAPCEDFQYVFDNINEKEGQKGRMNSFEKITHMIRKRFIYGVVRTEIITIEKKSFETELAYGFISSVPFPNFFKDLNRIVHQQLKYRMLNLNKDLFNKTQKIDIISDILKDFTSKSLQKSLCVDSYPVNLQLKANICGLRLVYNNQLNYIEPFLYKYSLYKLIKIFHYALTEKHMLIVCKNRKNLNQLFEVLRCILYPFNWLFPIIYYYSDFFEPFLSSPLPIMIGFIQNSENTKSKNQNQGELLDNSDFITIFAEDENKQDLNEPEGFEKRIKKCFKQFSKGIQQIKDSNKKMSPLLHKSAEERLSNKFYFYTKKLRKFIDSGKIEEQLDTFYLQFMQSQLVSYYKENLTVHSK